jgi:hypothetical protein
MRPLVADDIPACVRSKISGSLLMVIDGTERRIQRLQDLQQDPKRQKLNSSDKKKAYTCKNLFGTSVFRRPATEVAAGRRLCRRQSTGVDRHQTLE